MAVKIAVTPEYEDEKRQFNSNRLLLFLLLKKLTALSDIFFNFWKLCTGLFQGGTSFVDLLCFCSVLCLLCLCAHLFIFALWSPAGKGLTSWLSFVVSTCEFVTFPLVY